MKTPKPLPERIGPLFSAQNNDAAKNARRLLDTITICESVSLALCELVLKYRDRLPKCAVDDFETLADASRCIHEVGRQQITAVSIVKGLLPAYRHVKLMEKEEGGERPGGRVSLSMRKVKQFVALCRKAPAQISGTKRERETEVEEDVHTPPPKKLRRSERRVVSPVSEDHLDIDCFSGQPLNGQKEWTKIAIVNFIIELKKHKKIDPFLKKIVASKTCPHYQSATGPIFRMFGHWQKNKTITGKRGRPKVLSLREAKESVLTSLRTCGTEGSSQFKLRHMQSAFEEKRKAIAEQNGLDPESINCKVSLKTAKNLMTAVAMLEDRTLNFNTHKSINKTEARFRAEHSVMGAEAYALTALTTGIKAGGRQPWMNDKRFRGKVPSKETLESIEWMKELLPET